MTSALAAPNAEAEPLGSDYFDFYDGESPYEDSFEEHFDETYTIDLIRTIFCRSPPYRLLDCGGANGLTLQRFARKNVKAWGIEYSPYIYARTPEPWRARNIHGDVRKLPFDDGWGSEGWPVNAARASLPAPTCSVALSHYPAHHCHVPGRSIDPRRG